MILQHIKLVSTGIMSLVSIPGVILAQMAPDGSVVSQLKDVLMVVSVGGGMLLALLSLFFGKMLNERDAKNAERLADLKEDLIKFGASIEEVALKLQLDMTNRFAAKTEVDSKIDHIDQATRALHSRFDVTRTTVEDHERRIRNLEDTPKGSRNNGQ